MEVVASGIAEPARDVRGAIIMEPRELCGELAPVAGRFGAKLHWNYGVGRSWRVIVSVPTEADLVAFLSAGLHTRMACEMLAEIGRFVALETELQLFVEVDSDERVNAAEGWFFRIKSDPAPDRDFVFSSEDVSSC